jgi:hypothetical protein
VPGRNFGGLPFVRRSVRAVGLCIAEMLGVPESSSPSAAETLNSMDMSAPVLKLFISSDLLRDLKIRA